MCKTMPPKAVDPAFWEKVRTDVAYKPFVDEALSLYEEYMKAPILAESFATFKLFEETGNRGLFEKPYFLKRKRLNVCAILSMIYPDKKEYMESLEEIIWAICDEYTWSLPAHLSHAFEKDVDRIHIDLFAAETGYALSEIITILKDRIHPRVYKRAVEEIDRRILTSFETTPDFSWLGGHSNWAAVCAGSVGVTFMYMAPERFLKIKPKIDHTMETFLEGFSNAGICFEGIGYWNYGFGFFVAYAQHLYLFTEGKENYFAREKVRRIADFPNITDLGGIALSFSDSGNSKVTGNAAISGVLQQYYPDIRVPDPETYLILDGCARWCRYFDAFIYLPKQGAAADATFERYSPTAGWFLKRNASYGFAAKAGTNAEPHNHNDIGSFIFAANGKQLLRDLGAGVYSKQYFAKDTRYDYLCNCSRGHSVPMIDGKYQSAGAEYKGTMTYENGVVTIELGGAYDTDVRAVRELTFAEQSVTLKDTFEKTSGEANVTERFITTIQPEVKSDGVWIENLCLQASADWKVKINKDLHYGHGAEEIPVYFIDYATEAAKKIEFELKMELM